MASVELEIAARTYSIACRDGEEEHLRSLAAIIDRKAKDAAAALGSLTEARLLLFASLMMADELKEKQSGAPPAPAASAEPELDPAVAEALERIAERMEELAQRLEDAGPSA